MLSCLRGARIAAVLAFVSFSSDDCSSSGAEDAAGEPAAEIASRTHTTGLGFPLDAYRPSPEEDMVLQQGVDALVTDCMARCGFQYKPAPARTPSGQSRSRLYGVTEEREARSYGYRNPEQSRPKNSGKQASSPDESAVLPGDVKTYAGKEVPAGGCAAEASKKVLSGPNKIDSKRLADDLIIASSAKAVEDSRVRSVFTKWSDCMKEKGYSYATPVAVLEDGAISSGIGDVGGSGRSDRDGFRNSHRCLGGSGAGLDSGDQSRFCGSSAFLGSGHRAVGGPVSSVESEPDPTRRGTPSMTPRE